MIDHCSSVTKSVDPYLTGVKSDNAPQWLCGQFFVFVFGDLDIRKVELESIITDRM